MELMTLEFYEGKGIDTSEFTTEVFINAKNTGYIIRCNQAKCPGDRCSLCRSKFAIPAKEEK